MWVRDNATAYMNLDNVVSLGAVDVSGTFYVDAYLDDSTVLGRMNGSWSSEAEAMEAISRLVEGVDPTGY